MLYNVETMLVYLHKIQIKVYFCTFIFTLQRPFWGSLCLHDQFLFVPKNCLSEKCMCVCCVRNSLAWHGVTTGSRNARDGGGAKCFSFLLCEAQVIKDHLIKSALKRMMTRVTGLSCWQENAYAHLWNHCHQTPITVRVVLLPRGICHNSKNKTFFSCHIWQAKHKHIECCASQITM